MSNIEDVAAVLHQVHDKLPVDESAAAADTLRQVTGQLATAAKESTSLSNLAEPLVAATDSVGHAAENLKTAQVSIATYLGSIGAEGGVAQQSGGEQEASEKSAEEVTLEAYNALLAELDGGAGFDEQQSSQCLNEIMQTAQDLIRAGRLREALELRKKATSTLKTLAILDRQKYPSGMGHIEAWAHELEQLTLQLANAAEAQPGTALSHEIIDGILGVVGPLPTSDPGFAEFVVKHLTASMDRAENSLGPFTGIASIMSQLRLASCYAANITNMLHSEASREIAHILAGFHSIGDTINTSLGGNTLDKIIHEHPDTLLKTFGFEPDKMRGAWILANGDYRQGGSTRHFSKEDYMRRNLQTICRLEAAHQGSARELQEILKIHNFGRHDYSVWSDAYALCTGDTLRTTTEPVAVVVTFAKDGNGSLIQSQDIHAALHSVLRKKGVHLLPVELQAREDMAAIRENLIGLGMKGTPLLVVDSHGDTNSILTGGVREGVGQYFSDITSQDVRDGLGRFIRGIVGRNGTIVLYGCDNGKEPEGLAQVVADYTQREVIASPGSLAVKSVTADVEPSGKIHPTMILFDNDTGQDIAAVHFTPRRKVQAT
ncbi:MAG TPA: hypothetical protein VMR45_03825 [Patescibacteria group bacterium]|nr:hypothetical protein [Patescibacteria group bacterium]